MLILTSTRVISLIVDLMFFCTLTEIGPKVMGAISKFGRGLKMNVRPKLLLCLIVLLNLISLKTSRTRDAKIESSEVSMEEESAQCSKKVVLLEV